MKLIEIANEITSSERHEVAKLHNVTKNFVDVVLNGSRNSEAIVDSCELIIIKRKKMIQQLTQERLPELEMMMASMKGRVVIENDIN